jgi:cysteine desulfuration protein SufE
VNIIQRQQMTVKEFAALATWEDKYKRIIELGKKLPEYPEEFKIEQFKVKGCQSQVWLKTQISDQGIITSPATATPCWCVVCWR